MTRVTIMENIRRVAAFYCMPDVKEQYIIRSDVDEVTLLFQLYGHILDINGAPREGLSLIFVPEKEYDEVLRWARNTGKEIFYEKDGRPIVQKGFEHYPIPQKKGFGFIDKVGYHWHVESKSNE